MKNQKFDFEDITIVPATLSDISSRSEIELEYLPLIVAPMDTVVDAENYARFREIGYEVCLPRGVRVDDPEAVVSVGLDEVIKMIDSGDKLPPKLLIDVANGHMRKLYDVAAEIKAMHNVTLVVGNIANPETYGMYCEIGVDAVRVGIGGGSACTTSANTGIHYPMASLISECRSIASTYDNPASIIADGGFKKYDDIIKAIALGADYVMLGGVLNKTMESCGKKGYVGSNGYLIELSQETLKSLDPKTSEIYTEYRGMSTKQVQQAWGRKELKTAEGIAFKNRVEYTLAGWTDNFVDYLKSNMSYCGARNLDEYIGEVFYVHITENAKNRFRK
jgi:IMP dehydrogenase/GMP reductase